jgi:hypothetical protein
MRLSVRRRETAREVFDDSNPTASGQQPTFDPARREASTRHCVAAARPGETRPVEVTTHVVVMAADWRRTAAPISARPPKSPMHSPHMTCVDPAGRCA